ncbi:MAG: hypothetical protein ABR954_08395 [Dehalococcoidales bacterium]
MVEQGINRWIIKRHQVSLLLTILSIVFWSVSLIQAKLNFGFYGLISSYSINYFIALGLLTIASFLLWVSKEAQGKLLLLQLLILITMLWLTPVLIGSNPLFTNIVYRDIVHTSYLTENGHLNPAILFYHNWPSLFIFESGLIQITGATGIPNILILLSAYFLQFLILLPLYIFFRNTIETPNLRWLAIWLFYLANWTGQIYMEPQGIAFFFLIILLAVLTSVNIQQRNILAPRYSTIIIIVLAALVTIHLLTSIVAILLVFVFWMRKTLKFNFVILIFVFVAAWTIYGATYQFNHNLNSFIQHAFNIDVLFSQLTTPLGVSSTSHSAINELRIAYSGFFIIIGIIGILISRKHRSEADVVSFWLLISSFLILFTVLYDKEQLMRFYLFALIPLTYFAYKLFKNKIAQIVLLVLFMLVLPLNIITHYGNTFIDYFPPSEVAYTNFMRTFSALNNDVFGGQNLFLPGGHYYSLDSSSVLNGEITTKDYVYSGGSQYVHIGTRDQNTEIFTNNDDTLVPKLDESLKKSTDYGIIYNNPTISVYYKSVGN